MDRRLLRPALVTVAVLLAGLLTPGTAAAHPGTPPPQEPGVTLRVFDVQVPLSEHLHPQARRRPPTSTS